MPTSARSEGFSAFFERAGRSGLGAWSEALRRTTGERLRADRHGDIPAWVAALDRLPTIRATRTRFDTRCITATSPEAVEESVLATMREALQALHPWRKGPFCLHGVRIDAEWQSDMKWARLEAAAPPLQGLLVLDIGSGNGYYGYRALGAGAQLVLGIDPTLRFVHQFLAVNRLLRADRIAVLPFADRDLPDLQARDRVVFDTVFSMGVLYHRKDPGEHLKICRNCLRPGGQLVLETLVVDDAGDSVLVPRDRYAQMRNVHAVPGVPTLLRWIEDAGFADAQVVDVSPTTTDEQRSTTWMRFHSLADFLDPNDRTLTLEGHPAPLRAMLLAQA